MWMFILLMLLVVTIITTKSTFIVFVRESELSDEVGEGDHNVWFGVGLMSLPGSRKGEDVWQL